MKTKIKPISDITLAMEKALKDIARATPYSDLFPFRSEQSLNTLRALEKRGLIEFRRGNLQTSVYIRRVYGKARRKFIGDLDPIERKEITVNAGWFLTSEGYKLADALGFLAAWESPELHLRAELVEAIKTAKGAAIERVTRHLRKLTQE